MCMCACMYCVCMYACVYVCVCMYVCMCVCVHMNTVAHGGQKRAPGALVLELQKAMSHHVGAGNRSHLLEEQTGL